VVPRLPARVDTLLPAAPPLVDLDDVKDERVLFVVAGGQGQFVERDGTGYTVLLAEGAAFSEGGSPLADCTSADQRGCVDRSGRHPVARLTGALGLDFPKGKLLITGATARRYDVEVVLAE
jgi:hypothetical protein